MQKHAVSSQIAWGSQMVPDRMRDLHRDLLTAWHQRCRREAGHAVPGEARRRAGGEAEGSGCRAHSAFHTVAWSEHWALPQPPAFVAAAGLDGSPWCCSVHPERCYLSRCLLGSRELPPSYQAGGSNSSAALHIKSYPLCSKRYTLAQPDNAAEISIICQMNWTCWFQTSPGCGELHSQGRGINFPVLFSF